MSDEISVEWFEEWKKKRYPDKWDKHLTLKQMYKEIEKHLKKGESVLLNNFLTDKVKCEEVDGYTVLTFEGAMFDYILSDNPKFKKITKKYETENGGIIFDIYIDDITYHVKNKENPFNRPYTDGFILIAKFTDYKGNKMVCWHHISFYKQTKVLAPQKRAKKKVEEKFCYGIDDDMP